jgi:hypothetical protein
MGRNLSKYIMNWNYNNPVINGFYICCVKDYSFPFTLSWNKELGGWGEWWYGEYDDGLAEWKQFDNSLVVCYTSFQEIPMPEGWK